MNVSNQGTFGFIQIKNVSGLLGAAQKVEEKRLLHPHRVLGLMEQMGWLRRASVGARLCMFGDGRSVPSPALFPYKKMLVSLSSGSSFIALLGKRKGFLGREVQVGIFNFCAALSFSSPPPPGLSVLNTHTHTSFSYFFPSLVLSLCVKLTS